MNKIILFIYLFTISYSSFAQCNGRYNTEIFSTVSKITVTYSTIYNLDMDIYQPDGDVEINRPIIIFMHAGSFTGGDRSMSDMVDLCEAFAKRGYVTASIDYRLNPDPNSLQDSINIMTTVVEDISDAKAAIRYFRKDYDNGDNYDIDPNQIYIGGYSAGAIIAVNLSYLDNVSEAPQFMQTIINANGGIDGNSGNPGYSSDVKAVINIAGAVYKPYLIDVNDEPVVSVHAVNDGVVPYNCNEVYWSTLGFLADLVTVCGSQVIHNTANQLGIYNALLEFPTGDHTAFLNNIPQSINFISDFIYTTLDCYQPSKIDEISENILIYPNPVNGVLNVAFSKYYPYRLLIRNNIGQIVLHKNNLNANLNLDVTNYIKGVYFMELLYNNNKLIKKVIIK